MKKALERLGKTLTGDTSNFTGDVRRHRQKVFPDASGRGREKGDKSMSIPTTGTESLNYVPTILEKIGWRLFPSRLPDDPDPENKAKDMVITRTTVDLSFADRIRILISGRIVVEARTATENVVGGTRSVSCANVKPPAILRRDSFNKRKATP